MTVIAPCHVPLVTTEDVYWMQQAIEWAKHGAEMGTIPIGCVIVSPEGVSVGTYGTGTVCDPTAHSEIRAIRLTCQTIQSPNLLRGFSLYSTHECCMMCSGAINHAKISRVVYGSARQDLGHLFCAKPPAEFLLKHTSHPPVVLGGVLREECIELLADIAKWD